MSDELETKLLMAQRTLRRWLRTLDGVTEWDDRAAASERVEFWKGRIEHLERLIRERAA